MEQMGTIKRKVLLAVMMLVLTGISIIGFCQISKAAEFSSLSDFEK